MSEGRREVVIDLLASLTAAISLLEKGGRRAAPSDKMFKQMLKDYRQSCCRGREFILKEDEMVIRNKMRSDVPDSAGKRAPVELKGRYYHPGTGHIYNVTGYVFDAERERWMVQYRREDGGEAYVHLPEDFKREGRFLSVTTKDENDD